MFKVEAQAIQSWLHDINLPTGALILSVASGNKAMREIHQPFIHSDIFQPLTSRGLRCIHHELHPGEGVDIAGDLNDTKVQAELIALKSNLVLCCNLLEHVTAREVFAASLSQFVAPGGYLLVTVPKSFQYHADPIDTYFRPCPHQLAALFPNLSLVRSGVVVVESMWADLRAGGGLGTLTFRLARHLRRLITLLPDRQKWLSHAHSTLWLVRRREVSMVLLQRID
jgi:hypothetical protein